MFWKFSTHNSNTGLDTVLAKSDLKIQQVLDETSVLEEVKQENAKLVEYLRKDDVLEELTKLALAPLPSDAVKEVDVSDEKKTPLGSFFGLAKGKDSSKSRGSDEADEESDDKKAFKYAYLATEILSSEVWSITEALVGNPKHMNLFWEFLKQPAPLESQQAGYFTKIVESLLDKKTVDTLSFFKSLSNFVPLVCQHVDCPVIMDLLLKIISLEKTEAGQGVVDWLQVNGLIPKLLSYISPQQTAATQTSAGDFLKAIITISANATTQDQSVIGPNELTRELVSEPQVQSLIDMMLHGGNPLTVGVGIIIEVIRKNNSDYDPENQVGPEPKSSDPIYLGTLLRLFALRVPDFMKLLEDRYQTVTNVDGTKTVKKRVLNIASGEKIEPLGFDRFKTCELMAELLHCSNMALLNEKGSEDDIRLRDAERERLKACGKLRAARDLTTETEAGTGLDGSGYNKATLEDSPLSSPTSSDEEFEKVVYLSDDKTGEATIYTSSADFYPLEQVETPSSSSQSQLRGKGQDPELVHTPVVSNEPFVEHSSLEDAMKSSISSANEDMSSPASTNLQRSVHDLALNDDTPMARAESSDPKREDEESEFKPSFKRSKSAVTLTDLAQASTADVASPRDILYKNFRFDVGPDPDSTEYSEPEPIDEHHPRILVASDDSKSSASAIDEQRTYIYNDRKQGYLQLHGTCEPRTRENATEPKPPSPKKSSPISNISSRKIVFLIGPDDDESDDDESDNMSMTSASRAADAYRRTHEEYETSEHNTEGEVVGDLLKRMFVENKVVPTVLDMFFRFPWNNFLHNVVYDIVQQVFNGQIDNGQNRRLAIDLFETGHITSRIVQGQQDSDRAQTTTNVRLGYMGHLTLISEEVVKFSERHDPESLSLAVHQSLTNPEWIDYVEQKLSETRDRDNAVLGGVRPDPNGTPGIPGHLSLNPLSGKWGNISSSALADAGLTGNGAAESDELEGAEIGETDSADSAGLLGGYGRGLYRDDDMEEGGNTSGVHFADDTERSQTTTNASIPPPLNIPPSRARRQLAARLAQRKAEASISASEPETLTDEPEHQPIDQRIGTDAAHAIFSLDEDDTDIMSHRLDQRYISLDDLEDANSSDEENEDDQDGDAHASEFSRPEQHRRRSGSERLSPIPLAPLAMRSPPPPPTQVHEEQAGEEKAPKRPTLEALLSSEAARERRRRPSQDVNSPLVKATEPNVSSATEEKGEELVLGFDDYDEAEEESSDEDGEGLLEFRSHRKGSRH